MSYEKQTWETGDIVTSAKLNHMEDGIEEGGSNTPWDAVIRLTHAYNSGQDTTANLAVEIVSGTFESIHSKVSNGGSPIILIEYKSLFSTSLAYSFIGGFVNNDEDNVIGIVVYGPSLVEQSASKYFGHLAWLSNGEINWD